jgi:hypothetical protein
MWKKLITFLLIDRLRCWILLIKEEYWNFDTNVSFRPYIESFYCNWRFITIKMAIWEMTNKILLFTFFHFLTPAYSSSTVTVAILVAFGSYFSDFCNFLQCLQNFKRLQRHLDVNKRKLASLKKVQMAANCSRLFIEFIRFKVLIKPIQ